MKKILKSFFPFKYYNNSVWSNSLFYINNYRAIDYFIYECLYNTFFVIFFTFYIFWAEANIWRYKYLLFSLNHHLNLFISLFKGISLNIFLLYFLIAFKEENYSKLLKRLFLFVAFKNKLYKSCLRFSCLLPYILLKFNFLYLPTSSFFEKSSETSKF